MGSIPHEVVVRFLHSLPVVFYVVPRVPGCVADKETGPIVLYGRIKPVLIVSIYLGMSAIIG